jgi:hypothetical protein
MPFERRLDMEKSRFHMATLATILAFFTVACLLIRNATAPAGATPPAAGPSYQAEDEQVVPPAAETAPSAAVQRPAAQTAAARITAAQIPAQQALPEQTPREPAAPNQNTDEPTADPIAASEQSTFKVRRALETIDPRELLR